MSTKNTTYISKLLMIGILLGVYFSTNYALDQIQWASHSEIDLGLWYSFISLFVNLGIILLSAITTLSSKSKKDAIFNWVIGLVGMVAVGFILFMNHDYFSGNLLQGQLMRANPILYRILPLSLMYFFIPLTKKYNFEKIFVVSLILFGITQGYYIFYAAKYSSQRAWSDILTNHVWMRNMLFVLGLAITSAFHTKPKLWHFLIVGIEAIVMLILLHFNTFLLSFNDLLLEVSVFFIPIMIALFIKENEKSTL